jgi:hypothetical protein
VGLGELHDLIEVRTIAQNAPTQIFTPNASHFVEWREATHRFSALTVM